MYLLRWVQKRGRFELSLCIRGSPAREFHLKSAANQLVPENIAVMSQVTPQDGLGKAGQDQQDTLRPVSMDELFARAENDYVESKKEEGLRNAGLSSDRGSTRDTIGGQSSLASLYTAKRRTKYTRRPENDSQPSFEDEIQMIRDEMPEAVSGTSDAMDMLSEHGDRFRHY